MPKQTTPASAAAPVILPTAAHLPSPSGETKPFTNSRPGNVATPASFDNNDIDDGGHGQTRQTRRSKGRGKFVCSSPFYPASSPSYSSFSSTRLTHVGRNRITTLTPTMSTTVDTDEQDELDDRDEKVSLCILVLFI